MPPKITEFPSISSAPEPSLPPYGPLSPFDSPFFGRGAVKNTQVATPGKFAKAVVASTPTEGADFTDIQMAIDHVNSLGGGTVFVKAGTYKPQVKLTLYNKIQLVGEAPETTIIDFSSAVLTAGTTSTFSGAIESRGITVANTGTITVVAASATISGASTTFSSSGVVAGDSLFFSGGFYEVKSVTNDTTLILTQNYQGKNDSSLSYSILRTIDGAGLYNLMIANTVSNLTDGVVVLNNNNFRSANVLVKNAQRHGWNIFNNFNIGLDSCLATECVSAGFQIDGSAFGTGITFGLLSSCISYGNSVGLRSYGNQPLTISGGYYSDNANYGIYLAGRHAKVNGINITKNSESGVAISNEVEGSNNIISNCSIIANAGQSGVELIDGAGANTPTDNVIVGNVIRQNSGRGVIVGTEFINTIIKGNVLNINSVSGISTSGLRTIIEGNSIDVLTTRLGIVLNGSADNSIVSGNIIVGDGGANETGVHVATGADNCIISANQFISLTTPISNNGTATMIDTNQGAPNSSTAHIMTRGERDQTNITTTSTSFVDITSLAISAFTPGFTENVLINLSIGTSKNQTLDAVVFFEISINGDVTSGSALSYNVTTAVANDWDSDHVSWAAQLTAGMAWTIKGRWKVSSSTADLGAGVAWSTLNTTRIARQ